MYYINKIILGFLISTSWTILEKLIRIFLEKILFTSNVSFPL